MIPMLECDYFNSVVEDWTPECQEIEKHERKVCDYTLYVITPEMVGTYSIAEIIDDTHKKKEHTILCVLYEENGLSFDKVQTKSMKAVETLASENGAHVFTSLEDVASFLNILNKRV